ncbi:TonB-dependent receptor [Zymomonas mobilis subsp. mobilis NCIMB 11163]|uniref:TonB-dependent receptor domain-containing protein n=1 Tax=Zymomonas mobilis TaxID=542 RepID=UPI0001B7047E|nr:TonB-dependent receptor [Zymomonas mobilis]ACV74822.1 TonB-dependent receptor [Zymomonas mobilis subsp. mobilis NCIMB 11163]
MKNRYGLSSRWPVPLFRLGLLASISSFVAPALAAQADNEQVQSPVLSDNIPSVINLSDAPKTSSTDKKTDKTKDKDHNSTSDTNTITVTGTRLSKSRLSNVMAGSTLGEEQIKTRGYSDIGLALLRENPAFSVPNNSPIGSQSSYGAGQSFVSLFNLGDQRTLTLINGMRMVGGATASIFGAGSGSQVDVGTIPTSLIKKIDTKYGGAGASYGADAVAGVVNYQLDDHFKGIDFNAQGGFTQRLKAPQEKIYFKGGTEFNEGRGGIVFDVEYRHSGGVLAKDRNNVFGSEKTSYSHRPIGSTSPYSYVFTKGRRYIQSSVTGMPLTAGTMGSYPTYLNQIDLGVPSGNGNQAAMFSQDGKSLVPLTADTLIRDNYYGLGGNGIALSDYSQIYTPSKTLNLTTLGHYDLSDHIHATWQGWYQRGEAKSQVGQGTWQDTGFQGPMTMDSYLNGDSYTGYTDVNGPLTLSTNNPFLTAAERTTIVNALKAAGQPTDTFYMERLNQDLDAGMFRTKDQMYRLQGGLDGDFNAFGRHFNWKIAGEYSQYFNNTWQPSINTQNFINALNATTDAAGNIVCAAGYVNSTAATRSSTCSPLNPFGFNQMSQAAKDYVISDVHSKNRNSQRDIQAEINSTIAKLPAGDIRWDIGYEHRRESYNFNPGSFAEGELLSDGTRRRYGNSAPITAVSGAYHTHEAFGELDIPLISPNMHMAGAYNLSVTANGRYINNSMTGSYWTYMFGGAWWPTRDFGFSGNYAQSVRNPSVTELFATKSTVYDSASDPCSYEFLDSGPNPATRRANCAAAGIPTNFQSQIVNQTMPGTSGGNTHLKNETSHSFTAAVDFTPHFVPGLTINGAYIDVKINNEITSLGLGDLMSACYDSSSYPNSSYCGAFTRDPSTHQVTDFAEGYYNVASQHMQAVQGKINYVLPLRRLGLPDSAGTVELTGNYIHYVKNEQKILTSTYDMFGTTTQPQDNFTINMNYTRDRLSFQWQTIWYGKARYAVQVSDKTYENNRRPDFAYFNMTVGYRITDHIDASLIVNNITDALPKYPGSISVTRYYESLMGRSFKMSVGVHF